MRQYDLRLPSNLCAYSSDNISLHVDPTIRPVQASGKAVLGEPVG